MSRSSAIRFDDLIVFDFSAFPGTWNNINKSWPRGGEASGSVRITKICVDSRGIHEAQHSRGVDKCRRSRPAIAAAAAQFRIDFVGADTAQADADYGGEIRRRTPRFDFVFGINRSQGYEYVFVCGSYQLTKRIAPFVRIENAGDETISGSARVQLACACRIRRG